MIKLKTRKISDELLGVKSNVLLKDYTSYKIGGPAKYFFLAKTKEKVELAVKSAKKNKLAVFILGGGSNLLFSDKGFKGLVIKIEISEIKMEAGLICCGAGASLPKVANFAAENSMSGLEWAVGIPGITVGGAVFGNAQAFGTKISDLVILVEALDLKTFEVKQFSNAECGFSLKSSIFKNPPAGGRNLVILSAKLKLENKNKEDISKKVSEFLDYRKKSHPMSFASAGSVFVNPERIIKDRRLILKYPEFEEFNKRGVIRAGYLIEKAGLKGKKIGGAQISEQHANFIVNTGNAKAKDVLALINLVKKEVKKKFKINLETEVQLVGF